MSLVDRSGRTSERLLELLKTHGAQCAAQLSAQLGMTEQGVRRHLARLSADGLIEARTEKPLGRGRPQQVYALTEQGEARFPKSYPSFCIDILNHVQVAYGPQAVGEVMAARAETLARQIYKDWPDDLPLEQRLARLSEAFRLAGFHTVIEEDQDFYYLMHSNCPHLLVAREFVEICASERRIVAGALGEGVCQESRIATGGCQCRYRIPKTTDAVPEPL